MLKEITGNRTSNSRGWVNIGVLIGLVVSVLVNSAGANVINRVNYGAVFEEMKTVHSVYDYWTHTYKIEIPSIHGAKPHGFNSNKQIDLHASFVTVNQARTQYLEFLNHTLDYIKDMMPKEHL